MVQSEGRDNEPELNTVILHKQRVAIFGWTEIRFLLFANVLRPPLSFVTTSAASRFFCRAPPASASICAKKDAFGASLVASTVVFIDRLSDAHNVGSQPRKRKRLSATRGSDERGELGARRLHIQRDSVCACQEQASPIRMGCSGRHEENGYTSGRDGICPFHSSECRNGVWYVNAHEISRMSGEVENSFVEHYRSSSPPACNQRRQCTPLLSTFFSPRRTSKEPCNTIF